MHEVDRPVNASLLNYCERERRTAMWHDTGFKNLFLQKVTLLNSLSQQEMKLRINYKILDYSICFLFKENISYTDENQN